MKPQRKGKKLQTCKATVEITIGKDEDFVQVFKRLDNLIKGQFVEAVICNYEVPQQ